MHPAGPKLRREATGETTPGPQTFSHYPAIPPPMPLRLAVIDEQTCPYIVGRGSRSRAVWAEGCDDEAFEQLLDAGFRRSGHVIYQQACGGCRACMPMRVDTFAFERSASQRRVWRRNEDLEVRAGLPEYSSEKSELYRRYIEGQHQREGRRRSDGDVESTSPENVRTFLYESPVSTMEITYREPGGRLVGVGICDVTPNVLSTVYFFWEPEARRRSLGWFSLLWEIEAARSMGRRWYHLGYWVRGAPTMDYKRQVVPHELLGTDGVWRRPS